jgi:hypothetical protein
LATVVVVVALSPAAAQAAPAPLSFDATVVTIAGASPQGIATSDFNGDGHLDLATANEGVGGASGGVEILLRDVSGGFKDHGEIPAGTNPISLDVGEFNGDTSTWWSRTMARMTSRYSSAPATARSAQVRATRRAAVRRVPIPARQSPTP